MPRAAVGAAPHRAPAPKRPYWEMEAATLGTGGSLWVVDQIANLEGGAIRAGANHQGQVRVVTVNLFGTATSIAVQRNGQYYTRPTSPVRCHRDGHLTPGLTLATVTWRRVQP
jgi:hypothetical protein